MPHGKTWPVEGCKHRQLRDGLPSHLFNSHRNSRILQSALAKPTPSPGKCPVCDSQVSNIEAHLELRHDSFAVLVHALTKIVEPHSGPCVLCDIEAMAEEARERRAQLEETLQQ